MTPAKQRALIALADATNRPFLSAAPLMAIVEAVVVLDEAGLLGEGSPQTVSTEMIRKSVAAEEAMRNGINAAMGHEDEDDMRDHLQRVLDRVEVTDAALAMCEALDDAGKAKAVLNDEGFYSLTLEAQVRALVTAWREERDAAIPTPTVAACSDCGAVDDDSHLSGCDRGDPMTTVPVPCPKCGEPLNGGQTCLNFPACPDAVIPF